MARHESDSSDEEGEEYTTTNIVLGYASKETTDDSISQLGGLPVRQLHESSQSLSELLLTSIADVAAP